MLEEAADVERHRRRRLAGQHMLEMPPGELVLSLEEEGAGELQPNADELGPADQHGSEEIDRLVKQLVALVLRHARPLGSLGRLHPRPEQSGHILPSRWRAKGEADKDRGCGQGEGSRHGVLHSAREPRQKETPGPYSCAGGFTLAARSRALKLRSGLGVQVSSLVVLLGGAETTGDVAVQEVGGELPRRRSLGAKFCRFHYPPPFGLHRRSGRCNRPPRRRLWSCRRTCRPSSSSVSPYSPPPHQLHRPLLCLTTRQLEVVDGAGDGVDLAGAICTPSSVAHRSESSGFCPNVTPSTRHPP